METNLLRPGCKPKEKLVIKDPPIIMKELRSFLESKNHMCMKIIGIDDHKFKWCEKDICQEKLMWEDMERRQKEEDAFYTKLKSEGHTCLFIMESYSSRTGWCGQTPCNRST